MKREDLIARLAQLPPGTEIPDWQLRELNTPPPPVVTWRVDLLKKMQKNGESWHDVEKIMPDEGVLDLTYEEDSMGPPFFAWSAGFVYFVVWDWDHNRCRIESVPRHPQEALIPEAL